MFLYTIHIERSVCYRFCLIRGGDYVASRIGVKNILQ